MTRYTFLADSEIGEITVVATARNEVEAWNNLKREIKGLLEPIKIKNVKPCKVV